MIWVVFGLAVFILLFAFFLSMVSAGPKDSLEDQAEDIRKSFEAWEAKRKARAERRQRRRNRWQR